MSRRHAVLLLALALLLVAFVTRTAVGPTVLALGGAHGVHVSDVAALLVAAQLGAHGVLLPARHREGFALFTRRRPSP